LRKRWKEVVTIGTHILDVLDADIRGCVGKPNPEDMLITLYIDFWRALKLRAGTSSGFSGLSEYLFFRYVLFFIETTFGIKLVAQQCTKDTCIFQADSVLVTRDVRVSQFDSTAPNQKTDIAIFTRQNEPTGWRLVSAFEIKIGITGPVELTRMFERLNLLLRCSKANVFPVVFNSLNTAPQYKSAFDLFCSQSSARAFVISKSYANDACYLAR